MDPANVDKMVYLHENLKEVEIKYDFTLAQAQPANPDDADEEEVVVVAWATDQIIQSIFSINLLFYCYIQTEYKTKENLKKIKLCEDK